MSYTPTGFVRPSDGAVLMLATSDAVIQQAQTIAQTPAATLVLGTYASVVDDGSATGARVTEAQRLAFMLANDGSRDLSQATPLTTLPSGNLVFMDASGVLQLLPVSLVSSGSGSGSTATAPSQVGNLAAGTPTSTTVPLTWTAATGTAPISYAVQQSAHGANSYSNSSGTFGSTGGTVTGLTASTSYDFRVVATNSTGSTTTTLTAGVGTGASNAPTYPALTFAGGTQQYETTSPITGAASLKATAGVTASATFTASASPDAGSNGASDQGWVTVKFRFQSKTTAAFAGSGDFMVIGPAGGRGLALYFTGNSIGAHYAGNTAIAGTVNIRDGAVHAITATQYANGNKMSWKLTVESTSVANEDSVSAFNYFQTGSQSFTINEGSMTAGDLLDDIVLLNANDTLALAAGEPASTANTNVRWLFNDQTGTGS